jgi:hypothetical protein
MLNHLPTRVECTVHLTYYLSLRRHYPDQVHVLDFVETQYLVSPVKDAKYCVSTFG